MYNSTDIFKVVGVKYLSIVQLTNVSTLYANLKRNLYNN